MIAMEWLDLDIEDVKYLVQKGRHFNEFYGGFTINDNEWKANMPDIFPYSKKRITDKRYEIGYREEPMTIAEYFNTKTPTMAYAQIRTAPVVDGKDPNTYRYLTQAETVKFVQLFGIDRLKSHVDFEAEQAKESELISD